MKPSRTATIALAVAMTLAACGNATKPAGIATSAANPIVTLTSLDQFSAAFDADRGAPRLILLAAPT